MTPAALAACVLLAATAVGCASAPAEPEGASCATGAGRGVVVTEDDRSLPRGCRPAQVASLLGELFDALNRSDVDAAGALVINRQMLSLLERPAAGRPLRPRAA